MADLSVNPVSQPPLGGVGDSGVVPPKPGASQPQSAGPATPPPAGDSVQLSAGAQAAVATQASSGSTITETDANAQSVSLRQILGHQAFSGTARQNQAILSLLR